MINNENYIKMSLELHLFFARIMKEHSFFLEAGFMCKDSEFKKIANDFQNMFCELLNQVVDLSDGNISEDILLSKEIVTDNTLLSESITSQLSGIDINQNITKKEINLKSGPVIDNNELLMNVQKINQRALLLIENLIYFKTDVLNNVLECKLYTTNYPLLITHITNEAKMYHNLLLKIENRETITDEYIYEQEMFWNNIMKEHAEFIRGLLDPSEEELILTADKFASEYEEIMKKYQNNLEALTSTSLQETVQYKAFKEAAETGLLNCKIKSIIIPLLADHVLREANHFIRILRNYNRLT